MRAATGRLALDPHADSQRVNLRRLGYNPAGSSARVFVDSVRMQDHSAGDV